MKITRTQRFKYLISFYIKTFVKLIRYKTAFLSARTTECDLNNGTFLYGRKNGHITVRWS